MERIKGMRIFNGKRYAFHSWSRSKDWSDRIAKRIRKEGNYSVRVIKEKTKSTNEIVYSIYLG